MHDNNRAISPAISSVIMTGAIIILVLGAAVYAQSYLGSSIAANEFNTSQQFMLTTGLQIDDVAWMMGRTQTVSYSSRYGAVQFEPQVLNYSVEIKTNQSAVWEPVNLTLETGIVLFNMPTTAYSLGNNYLHHIFPSSNYSFVQEGPSAPVSYVYAIQKAPMSDGSFARVVVVPSIRMLNTLVGSQSYVEFYLPVLQNGANRGLSQSVTLTGKSVVQYVQSGVTQVRFNATFPSAAEGFDSAFFPFGNTLDLNHYTITIDLPPSSTLQLYVGEVAVSLGLYG